MPHARRYVLALSFVALAACSGELIPVSGEPLASGGPDASTIDDSTPAGMFAAHVQPMLRAKCTVCHEIGGVGPELWGAVGEADDYTESVADTVLNGGFVAAGATLLTKGEHSGVIWWTAEQETQITDWFAAEAAAQ
jgi:hypothetical protein